MKHIPMLAACGLLLATIGFSAPADARPGHRVHKPVCKIVWVHHHKVRRCR